ncbi:MAG: hypothetical protein AAF716_19370 [Cyanobacteria bacterium P01_D01_bin.1]
MTNAQPAHTVTSNQAYWPFASSSLQSSLSNTLYKAVQQIGRLSANVLSLLSVSSDPHVWATCNAAGKTVWNAEDPISGKVILGVSETELRVWLEERYQF